MSTESLKWADLEVRLRHGCWQLHREEETVGDKQRPHTAVWVTMSPGVGTLTSARAPIPEGQCTEQ